MVRIGPYTKTLPFLRDMNKNMKCDVNYFHINKSDFFKI